MCHLIPSFRCLNRSLGSLQLLYQRLILFHTPAVRPRLQDCRLTFTRQFEIGSSSQHPSPSGAGNSPSYLSTMAPQLTFSTLNVTNIVTTRLASVEDYLP
ncbi:unnamed protein product [Cuscuta europaea]|uniref:Uncharacterized protein n=1 Tax=Cuscuta europaea TaxID=41803 RepID=A0A9P1EN15_CUSEU|nr:unnamed protein product [Cuscuta europaea]